MDKIEECLNAFIQEVEFRKTVDYSDKKSVKQYNLAYDRAAGYAQYIDKHHPEHISTFMNLLNHPDIYVVACCAPMILQMENSTCEQKRMALEAISRLTDDTRLSKIDRLGFKTSLEKWKDMYK